MKKLKQKHWGACLRLPIPCEAEQVWTSGFRLPCCCSGPPPLWRGFSIQNQANIAEANEMVFDGRTEMQCLEPKGSVWWVGLAGQRVPWSLSFGYFTSATHHAQAGAFWCLRHWTTSQEIYRYPGALRIKIRGQDWLAGLENVNHIRTSPLFSSPSSLELRGNTGAKLHCPHGLSFSMKTRKSFQCWIWKDWHFSLSASEFNL